MRLWTTFHPPGNLLELPAREGRRQNMGGRSNTTDGPVTPGDVIQAFQNNSAEDLRTPDFWACPQRNKRTLSLYTPQGVRAFRDKRALLEQLGVSIYDHTNRVSTMKSDIMKACRGRKDFVEVFPDFQIQLGWEDGNPTGTFMARTRWAKWFYRELMAHLRGEGLNVSKISLVDRTES